MKTAVQSETKVTHFSKTVRALCFLSCLLALQLFNPLLPQVRADANWTGAGGDNDWFNTANWNATPSGNVTIGNAAMPSGTAIITSGSVLVDKYLSVGYENGANGTAVLILKGTGTLYNTSIGMIGRGGASASTHGAVYMNDSAVWINTNEISVGRGGALGSTGYLEIAGNASVQAKKFNIAAGSSAVRGEMLITDNGRLHTTDVAYLGGSASSAIRDVGVATIAGNGFWSATTAATNSYGFVIGAYGTGTLTVQDSGSIALTRNSSVAAMLIGRYASGTGALILKDNANLSMTGNSNAAIMVGESGNALFQISDNAVANIGRVFISASASAHGAIALNGGRLTTRIVENRLGTGSLIFAGGTLQAAADNTTFIRTTGGAFAVTTTGAGAFIDSNGYAITVAPSLSGDGGLTKLGEGVLTLSAAQGYTGTTAVTAGTLKLAAANALANSVAVTLESTGSIDGNAADQTLKNLSGSGVILNTAGLTLDSAADTAFAGDITAVSVAKTGAARLALTGTVTGALAINAGVLDITGGDLHVTAGATIAGTGTLAINTASGLLSVGSLAFGSGATVNAVNFDPTAGATVTLVDSAAAITAPLSSLTLLADGVAPAASLERWVLPVLALDSTGKLLQVAPDLAWNTTTYAAHGTFDIASGDAFTLSAVFADRSGAGFTPFENWDGKTLVKTGAGSLTLATAAAYTGTTLVSGGTLQLAVPDAIAASTAVQIAPGATLLAEGSQTINNLADAGAGGAPVLAAAPAGADFVLYSNQDTTFSGVITGPASVTKTGAATLALSATGAIATLENLTVSAGALALSSGTLSASGTFALAGTGTLAISAGSALMHTGTAVFAPGATINILSFAGNGDVDLLVSGALLPPDALTSISLLNNGVANTLSIDTYNLYELKTDPTGNKLQLAADLVWNSTGAAHGTYNIAAAAIFDPAVSLADRAGGSFTAFAGWDGKSLTKTGAGTLVFNTVNTYTGTTLVSAGTLQLASKNAIATSTAVQIAPGATILATGTQTINNLATAGPDGSEAPVLAAAPGGADFILYSNQDTTFSGLITGAASVTKTGDAALTLSASNSFTGGATVAGGKLIATRADALGAGNLTIASGATLELAAAGPATEFTGVIAGGGAILKTGAGSVTLAGSSLAAKDILVDAGELSIGDATRATTATAVSATIATGGSLALGAGSSLTVSDATAFEAGSSLSLIIGSGTGPSLAATDITLGAGVSLNIAGVTGNTSMPFTLVQASNAITGTFATISIGGGAIDGVADYLTIATEKTADGKRYLMDAILTWYSTSTGAHGTFTLNDAGGAFTLAAILDDQSANPAQNWDGKSLTKAGLGTLVLAAANTYTGTTLVSAGTLQLATPNAIAASSDVRIEADATLLATGAQTISNLVGTGTLQGAADATLILNSTQDTTFSGIIAGPAALQKTGTATLALTGENTFAGDITIGSGRLAAASFSALGTGTAIHIGADGTLELAIDAVGGTLAQTLSGAGVFHANSAGGILELSTASPGFSGTAGISGGTLLATHAEALGSAAVNIAENATLEYRDIAGAELSNAFGGAGVLLVTTGTLDFVAAGAGVANITLDRSTLTLAHTLAPGAGVASVTAGPASRLVLAADNIHLAALNLNNATLAFASQVGGGSPSNSHRTATINTLSGAGSIEMNVNLATAAAGVNPGGTTADFLRVTSAASGSHTLALNLGGTRPANHGVTIELISTGPSSAAFTLDAPGEKITLGLTAYELKQGDGSVLLPQTTSWYLADAGYSTIADTIYTHAAMLTNDWHHALDTLNLRMGDLRATASGKKPPKADRWFRFHANRVDSDDTLSGVSFDQVAWGFTFGADKQFRSGNITTAIGAFIDIGYLNRTHGPASTDSKNTSAGLYATYLAGSGWFTDIVLRIDHYDNDFSLPTRNAQIQDAGYKNLAKGASIEFGRRFDGANWWFELSAQVAAVLIDEADYDIHPEQIRLHVEIDEITAIHTRAQTRIGRRLGKSKWHPYVRLAIANSNTRNGAIRTPGLERTLDGYDDVRGEFGGGFTYAISRRSQFFADYEYTYAESYTRPWSLNTGYRVAW
ncbi:autotransporter outer membrane beta-barrel domain-containing protein [Ereboglobus luteus]|uniref:Autotransporter domain-containing protein n=1 Tax=Ereboglobus luteus TaxID=1796921 RepID=A0A2U8E3I9_9BACT|nr:autotransporter outer membrane beta-barrel domain-containing protein [Ereboglobus luteus]AWI09439.1 hypothetical protein CKA38_09440 [Ereboglobus luteus]